MRLTVREALREATSVLTATLTPPAEPVPEFRAMMQCLSEDSCRKYRQIVYEDPGSRTVRRFFFN
jgi:phosphoenolpyruvate carboxylase